MKLTAATAPEQAGAMRLSIRRIIVEGATAFHARELEALGSGLIGREVSLQDIYDFSARITARYGEFGYVLSRAIIPPQELKRSGATLRIRVIEGYIDRVEWPAGLERYRNFFTDYTAKITGSRPINVKVIERYLLLANDLPGLSFRSTLKPSDANQGAATLVNLSASGRAGSIPAVRTMRPAPVASPAGTRSLLRRSAPERP